MTVEERLQTIERTASGSAGEDRRSSLSGCDVPQFARAASSHRDRVAEQFPPMGKSFAERQGPL